MVRNFLFHRVSPERDPLWDPMDVFLFDKCVKFIRDKYHVVRIEDLGSINVTKKRYATISFDDGYKDNILYALPILEKYGVKASFYVVTDCINKNLPTWTYIIEYLFQNTRKKTINTDFNFLPANVRTRELKTKSERVFFIRKLKPKLKTITHEQRELVLKEIYSAFNDVQIPGMMMSWSDLERLARMGHAVGSHTISHSMLGTMQDSRQIFHELKMSGKEIEKQTGRFPLSIAYPVGSYDSQVIELSELAGYKIGLAVKQEIYNPEKDSIFAVPRIELYNESWLKTRMRINGTLEHIKKLIGYK